MRRWCYDIYWPSGLNYLVLVFSLYHIWLSLPTGLSGWSPGCHSNVEWPSWSSKCLILRSCTDNFIKAIRFLKSWGLVWLPHPATMFILCLFFRAGTHYSPLLLDITCITGWNEKLKGIPIASIWQTHGKTQSIPRNNSEYGSETPKSKSI